MAKSCARRAYFRSWLSRARVENFSVAKPANVGGRREKSYIHNILAATDKIREKVF